MSSPQLVPPNPSAARPRRGARPPSHKGVLDLDPRSLYRAAKRQSPAFWALCFYVFIEYVRPQSVYTQFDVLPWGAVSLALAVGLAPFDRHGRAVKQIVPVEPVFWAFSAVLLISILTSYAPSWGWTGLEVYFNWFLLVLLMGRLVNSKERLLIFFLLFLLWSFKMSQHAARSFASIGFGFRDWGATGGPGWFHNSGEFAVQMAVILPLGLAWVMSMRSRWPRWKSWLLAAMVPGTAALGLVASSSRGGQLGGLAALGFLLLRGKRRIAGIVSLAVTLAVLWLLVPAEQKQRFTAMGEDNTSVARLTFWADGLEIMERYPVFGVGFEAWVPYCRQHCTFPTLPHNIFIEAGAEMGYTGLLLLLGLIGGCFLVNRDTRKRARGDDDWDRLLRGLSDGLDGGMVGYVVSGFFVTVLFYPFLWANLGFVIVLNLVARRAQRARRPGRRRAYA